MFRTTSPESPVFVKTQELCQTILEQPEFAAIRLRIQTFLTDDAARAQYDAVNAKGMALQQKQQTGMPLTDEEIADFELGRDNLLSNPTAQSFFEAQQEIREVRDAITKYVARTFEINKVPTPADIQSCGEGCSCH